MNQPTFHIENRREKFCLVIVIILLIFIFYILYLEHAGAINEENLQNVAPGLSEGRIFVLIIQPYSDYIFQELEIIIWRKSKSPLRSTIEFKEGCHFSGNIP